MPGRAFLDKTLGYPVNGNKKKNDPEQRIPGIGIDDAVEGKVGDENGRDQVKQDPVQDIFLLQLKPDLFPDKVAYFVTQHPISLLIGNISKQNGRIVYSTIRPSSFIRNNLVYD